jgi:uncharacterized membrane protein YccF (DUF307 family)
MRTLGNILWHVPFMGFVTATFTYLAGLILTLLVIPAPIGLGLMEYGKFLFAPFGRAMVSKAELNIEQNAYWKTYSGIVIVIYFPFGLLYAIMAAIQAAFLAMTILGIPAALVIAKSLGTFLNPVNKKCVHIAVKEELERRHAQAIVSKAFGEQESEASRDLHNTPAPAVEPAPIMRDSSRESLQETLPEQAFVPEPASNVSLPSGKPEDSAASADTEVRPSEPDNSQELFKTFVVFGVIVAAVVGAWLWERERHWDQTLNNSLRQQQQVLEEERQARQAAEAEARRARLALEAAEARDRNDDLSAARRRGNELQAEMERVRPAPQPEPEPEGEEEAAQTVGFTVVNNTSGTVNVAFFDRDNHVHVDPPFDRFYILNGNSTQTYRVSCTAGQNICYGATMPGGNMMPFWGSGRDGKQPCTGCCLACPATGSLVKTLNYSDSRRPKPTITWKITDNTTKPLSVTLFSKTRFQFGWPAWDRNWSTKGGENVYTVDCQEGEQICFGAWITNYINGPYWGVGPYAKFGCTNCCGVCDGGTYSASLGD